MRAAAGLAAMIAVALGVASPSRLHAEAPAAAYVPTRANLAARTWFQNAKFGIFLHWGLYSELGGVGQAGLAEWIMHDAKIPAAKYQRLAQFFNPDKFDAEAWVKTVQAAGASYIVFTAKHHDGFAMFDSQVSPYNVVKATPFAHDPIKDLAAACRRHGIKLFFYFSQVDWHNPDYYPHGNYEQSVKRPEGGDWERYLTYQDTQIRELLTQYGEIGGIWLDGYWDLDGTPMQDRWRLDRTYAMIHALQPQALIVNNHYHTPFPGEDYQTFERDLPGENGMGFNTTAIGALPLETSETMNGSWGFNLTDDAYKTPRTLIRTLASAAGRNANLLLNTGPMPNGEIQPENIATMEKIGAWLKTYGESIYGTRGGPIGPRPWGVTTQKGKQIYVHMLDAPDDRLFLPIGGHVVAARMLADGKPVRTVAVAGGIDLVGVAKPGDVWDQVVVLTLQ